jgi:hypothetical protein
MEDPNRVRPTVETELVKRPNERKDSELPKWRKSSTEIAKTDPNRVRAWIDNELLRAVNERRASELPMWRKSNTAIADPKRAKPRTETELDKRAKLRRDSALPR